MDRLGIALAGFVLALAICGLVILMLSLAYTLFVSSDTFLRGVQVIIYVIAAGTAVWAFITEP